MEFDFESPWLYILLLVLVWVVVASLIELLAFDGDVVSTVVQGAAGGVVFAIGTYYFQRRGR
ncbi:hypothetical protein [Halopiger xanaduensis]|uniref:Uncharacterized protein n=1 Tax=Halopiger xanaduensis (strain DSM 18323 / JCM 14033 / SH-6) TaxID=797210 RepID=F8D9R5_HALXS|nr:hypothetical protein [Halopiger xanaduensis]AEH37668.1 hypothetical protein Halxa_3053 [Halopiger xanaduensis SH-6]